jgi:hypothetical protein
MASSRKSTKRATKKKRSSAKRSSSKKGTTRKTGTKGRAKALRAAKGGIKSVRQAGERTWETLKSTTAQVVEGVKDMI